MATHSSTSSSELRASFEGLVEAPAGPPWALVLAVALIVLVEIGLRSALADDDFLDAHVQPNSSMQQALDVDGAAEFAFLGASVSWNGLVAPDVASALEAELGREVTVANYSIFGARAELAADMAHILARTEPRPRVVYYAVTFHAITRTEKLDETAWIWTLADWRREFATRGYEVLEDLPVALRNECARYSRIVEVRRDPIRYWERLGSEGRFNPNPMRGGYVMGHLNNPNQSFAGRPAGRDEAGDLLERALVERDLVGGSDRALFGEKRIEKLLSIPVTLKAAGIEVVFFEIPLPEVHVSKMPPDTRAQFDAVMQRVTAETGTRFVPFDYLGIEVDDRDFKDASHMNGRGARRLTKALVERVILPHARRVLREPR